MTEEEWEKAMIALRTQPIIDHGESRGPWPVTAGLDRTLGSEYRADTSDPPQHTLYWRSGSLVIPGDGPGPGMDPWLFR